MVKALELLGAELQEVAELSEMVKAPELKVLVVEL